MRDRYGRTIECGDSIQFDPKFLGSPDGQLRGVVMEVKGGIVTSGDQPVHEVITVTITASLPVPVAAALPVVVVDKNPELARRLAAGRSALV